MLVLIKTSALAYCGNPTRTHTITTGNAQEMNYTFSIKTGMDKGHGNHRYGLYISIYNTHTL